MTKIKQQNLSLELVKLIAACFVVFIHAPFPGTLGTMVMCLARFAVPFFFAVSGYYSFGIGPEKVKSRAVHILKLHLLTAVLAVAAGCICRMPYTLDVLHFLRWEAVPDGDDLIRWLILQENPYGGHLWYLSALLLCYGVLWAYRTFRQDEKENGPLYQAGFTLFAIFCAMSMLARMEGMDVPFKAYRNGWLMGLPMFFMGMFLNEYRQRLMMNFRLTDRKMVLLIALGLVLSLVQRLNGYSAELPLGMMLAVPVLILFLMAHPRLPVEAKWLERMASRFGTVSTAVYLLHMPALDLYNRFLKEKFTLFLGAGEESLMPIAVLAITFVGAVIWERTERLLHYKKSPR